MAQTTPFLGLSLLASTDSVVPDIALLSQNFTAIDTNAEAHQQATTNVHGIANTGKLATTAAAAAFAIALGS